MNNNQKNFIEVLSEILKKLIEIQETNAKSISAMQEPIKDSTVLLKQINSHFTNGFRSDIKKHVTEEFIKTVAEIHILNNELKNLENDIDKLCHSVNKLKDSIEKSFSFWHYIKISLTVLGGLAAAISGIVVLINSMKS